MTRQRGSRHSLTAEANMNRLIRHWRMERRVTTVMDTNIRRYPGDFLEMIRLMTTGATPRRLELVGQGQLLELRENNKDLQKQPLNYAIYRWHNRGVSDPDTTYTAEMVYYSEIDAYDIEHVKLGATIPSRRLPLRRIDPFCAILR